MLDGDSTGFIEEAEAFAIGRALGCDPQKYWADLRVMDTDGDGKVSLAEYLKGMEGAGMDATAALMLKQEIDMKVGRRARQGTRPGGLAPIGGGLAPIGGGPPPLGSLKPAAGGSPETAAKAVFAKIDKDGSGQLDKQEVHDALELTSSSECATW